METRNHKNGAKLKSQKSRKKFKIKMKRLHYYTVLIFVLGFCVNVNSQTTKKYTKKQISTTTVSVNNSSTSFLLEKLLKNEMPISLNFAKSVLGNNFVSEEDELFGSSYIWKFKDGGVFNLQEVNGNGLDVLNISSSQQSSLKCIMGLTINQSTYSDCRTLFPNFKKSADGIIHKYKFLKGKTWFFLTFNYKNILTSICCASWEMDTTG